MLVKYLRLIYIRTGQSLLIKMQKDTPITNDITIESGALGDNLELWILHKAYLDLTDSQEEKEGSKDDKN